MAEIKLKKRDASGRAAYRLREVAKYLNENAEKLVGNLDSIYVIEGGLRFSFEITDDCSIPTVKVEKECIVLNKGESKMKSGGSGVAYN